MSSSIEFPLVNPDEMAAEAWAAMARRDTGEALRLWQKLRQDFPERPDGHVWPVQLLWQNGRAEEAEAMAAQARTRFPDHAELLVQSAWVAMARERWDEALRWWTAVREADPQRLDGYVRAARVLWQAGRIDEAETMAGEALRRFPDDGEALAESAWVAVARRDWDEALRRWTLVSRTHPDRADGDIGLIQASRMVGRVDAAEQRANEALARHPGNPDLLVEYVWAAVARDDWTTAAARLETARAKQPDPKRFETSLGWVEAEVRRRGLVLAAPSRPAPLRRAAPAARRKDAAAGAANVSTADLMLAFESLGERCDFGAVQRHFGVEPLGLLRFAYTKYEPLLAALADRFAAVGSVEDTGFEMYRDETILVMKKYGLIFHTFVYQVELENDEKREAFRRQQRRRLSFLRDKLVSDLEEPQKIWIYATDERAADTDVATLFQALRGYGKNSLLYVRPADAAHAQGEVEELEDGLYAGYFRSLADFVSGEQPPFELWRQICQQTYGLARASRRR